MHLPESRVRQLRPIPSHTSADHTLPAAVPTAQPQHHRLHTLHCTRHHSQPLHRHHCCQHQHYHIRDRTLHHTVVPASSALRLPNLAHNAPLLPKLPAPNLHSSHKHPARSLPNPPLPNPPHLHGLSCPSSTFCLFCQLLPPPPSCLSSPFCSSWLIQAPELEEWEAPRACLSCAFCSSSPSHHRLHPVFPPSRRACKALPRLLVHNVSLHTSLESTSPTSWLLLSQSCHHL
mmetsp:Transcript_5212/g.9094  ORF Transcript_5212/g.9094 Transcript_5212/m.9094 type:complete len:232 (+) Transcript_5212:339-1034(+)